jgi:putative ABC transport system permease protein
MFEALSMGLLGAAIGIALGLGYGRLLVSALMRDIGPVQVIPWSWVAGLAVLAALAAMAAAVLPARRAGRVSIVDSLAEA